MQIQPASLNKSKPRSNVAHPGITCLPRLTIWRRIFRRIIVWFLRLLVWLFTRTHTDGMENVPLNTPFLIVSNHLGDADLVVGIAVSPVPVEILAKAELYDYPILGKLMDAYGVIWVHRGQPDRRALRAAVEGLRQGRLVGIAPEGRESLTGALEEGINGAAYLALKAGVPVLPITFTGTENARIYGNMKRLRRTWVAVTIGPMFRLEDLPDRRQALEQGTLKIMSVLASQLPPEYQGVYRSSTSNSVEERGDGGK